jgi:hypothetical protein
MEAWHMSVQRDVGIGDPSYSRELPAPVRARSILLSTHQLLVEELSSAALASPHPAPPRLSSGAVQYGFVGVDAVPYLVSLGGEDLRPGPLLALATGLDEQLGTLHVTGELGEWIYPSTDIRVADALQEHRECMVEPAQDLIEILRLRVAPLRVTRVWITPPGRDEPEAVDRAGFETAEPDAWAAFTHDVIRHLNEHHHDDLLALARTAGAASSTAASLTRLDAGGAIITAMGREGLMNVVMPFDPPAGSPGEASRRLTGIH